MPREPDAQERLTTRIKPLIDDNPRLARHKTGAKADWKKGRVSFPRMDLWTGGANSPAALADKPLPVVILDEVAKFPPQTGKEPDAVSLADNRAKTFRRRRKRGAISSPTVSTDLVMREYGRSDRRRWQWPCPGCGTWQPFEFQRLRWPEGAEPDRIRSQFLVWYECASCGHELHDDPTQAAKRGLMDVGRWVPEGCHVGERGELVGEAAGPSDHRGYHVHGLMGSAVPWSDLAAKFLESKADRVLLMDFFNGQLGEPFDEEIEKTSEDTIKACAIPYAPNTLPAAAVLLTAGVDIGLYQLHYVVRAWGPDQESWLVARGQLGGLNELRREVMQARYARPGGEALEVALTCIDSGFEPDPVYLFCADWPDRARPIKGRDKLDNGEYFSAKVIERDHMDGRPIPFGQQLWSFNTDYLQAKLNRLVNGREGAGWHVFGGEVDGVEYDVGDEYRRALCAEHRALVAGKPVWKRKPGYGSPHFRDAERYALAAAMMLRVWEIRVDEPRPEAAAAGPVEDEGDWLGDEDWLGEDGGEGWV